MLKIGLIKEGKIPEDNRVALTPAQCVWVQQQYPGLKIYVQQSVSRCFSDKEYLQAGIEVVADVEGCDILFGIKEVPLNDLIENKTYLFFSHTRKKQPYNRGLLGAILEKNITLIDYECLEHEDGQRIIGFGFFAGVVGAHNGMMAYGERVGLYSLDRVYKQRSFRDMIHCYFGIKLPNLKVAITGSGRVAHGIIEIMNLLGLHEVEPEDYLSRRFPYPVFTQLKGAGLYRSISDESYSRSHFHENHQLYKSIFLPYASQTDILMNGVYWEPGVPRLFEKTDVKNDAFIIQTIADITDDANGSVPINLGDQSIANPVYGVDKNTLKKTEPYLPGSIDIIAVGNLPNELPRDASKYFGDQLIKYVLDELFNQNAGLIENATIAKGGLLTKKFEYLQAYVDGVED